MRLDRRTFLSAAAVALAGCAAQPAPGTTTSSQPRRGGRLRVAFAGGGAQESLDPHLANLFLEASRSKAMFDKLADYGTDVSIVPRLASGWEAGKELTTWRVTLREAAFHDGRPVRAADVLHSYARIADEKRTFRAKANLALIDLPNSRAAGERTVEFALKRPYAEFPNVLAAFGAYIVPEGADEFSRPVGSGPFAFGSFQPGRSLLLKRFAGHWDGAPYVDELEYLVANEESARVNAVLGGQADYAHDLTPATARTHEGGGRMAVVRLSNSGMQAFAMKVDRPPFDDLRLRQAMFLLADRSQMVDSVLAGAGQAGNDLFGKDYLYYAADLPQRTPDLEQARWLIERAGAKGLRIQLDTSAAASGFIEAASVFADQARQAGLEITAKTGNKDTYWADVLNKGTICCYRSGAMPIETHISQRLLSHSTTNATKWARPEFDALYDQAVGTADETRRRALYLDMQRTLHAEGGFLVWGFADWLLGTSPRLRGVVNAPANTLDWARFDKVWLA
ncbi:ABC transporter substrate-binding protein [Nonomuraea zeae]|uniref:ABC transporter substrate-binding protein n=1 Tax=Nonomuraea zeae TaxID=1642303 RepID=A0A5S4GV72_9ACTN|nr:ABC transporter substrate-binding protein [Nonomuraea zeae]TMR36354.1 ABC transporter substrate-binding protein [Nonomuraea zeae]